MTQETAKSIILGELRKRMSVIISMVFFLILTILISVTLPLLFKRLVDVTIPARDMSEAGLLLFALITIPLISAALNSIYDYQREIIGEAIAQALRQKLFNHLVHANLRDLESTETGHIIHHITRGCGLVGDDYIVDRTYTADIQRIAIHRSACRDDAHQLAFDANNAAGLSNNLPILKAVAKLCQDA